MKLPGVFVAGTDTGVGKTRVSSGLLKALHIRGHRVAGMKPVAAGAIKKDGRLISEDAAFLAQASGQDTPYEWLNPYCLSLAESPHLAAAAAGVRIEMQRIRQCFGQLSARHEWVLVEGAGGWFSPITPKATMADIAMMLKLPVLLVVGLRLGCLNHALLSAAAIRASGLAFAGWIGSTLQHPWGALDANVEALSERLHSPPLAILPWSDNAAHDALVLDAAAGVLLS